MESKKTVVSTLPITLLNQSERPYFAVKLEVYQKWTLNNLVDQFNLCGEEVLQALLSLCGVSKLNENEYISLTVVFWHIFKLSSELKLFEIEKAVRIVDSIILDTISRCSNFGYPDKHQTNLGTSLEGSTTYKTKSSKEYLDFAKVRYICSLCEKTENCEDSFRQHFVHCHGNRVSVDDSKPNQTKMYCKQEKYVINTENTSNSSSTGSSSVGSSKRKRKLPVQYLKRQVVKTELSNCKDEDLGPTEGISDHTPPPEKYPTLEYDSRRTFATHCLATSYPAYPDMDEDIPRPVDPQPRTTICYKPSPDSKPPNIARNTEKTNVAEILRQMQVDFESPGCSRGNDLLSNLEKSQTIKKSSDGCRYSAEQQTDLPNITVGQTYNLDLFRRLVGKAQVKGRGIDRQQRQVLPGGDSSKVHDADASSAWLRWMMTSSQPQRNCLGEQLSPDSTRSTSPQITTNRCNFCNDHFSNGEELFQHYQEVHGSSSQTTAGDQQFKVMWLKQVIPKYLTSCAGGCVSRDELLERTAGPGAVDTSDASQWGPSCNKAVREIFPESQALRKGKYKKTYYFGVKYASHSFGEETVEEDLDEDVEKLSCSALRNMTQDVDKIAQHVQGFVRWTGHMDDYLTRDTVLQILGRRLGEAEVHNCGLQCNRALRQVFPEVFMKRKGKFKTTCYYGVELITNDLSARHQSTNWSKSSSGPPVVNVRDIIECSIPAHMSRLKPKPEDLSTTPPKSTKVKAEAVGTEGICDDEDRAKITEKSEQLSPNKMDDDENEVDSQILDLTRSKRKQQSKSLPLEKLIGS